MYRNNKRNNKKQSSKQAKKEAAALNGCACVNVELYLKNGDQKTPGKVKAKIYFHRQSRDRMVAILRQLQIGRSEKQADQKNILSQYEINPETCDASSLLNFDHLFNEQDGTASKVHSSYVDVNLRIELPIVMVEVSDHLKYGRVSFVSAGKKCQDNDGKTLAVMQKWTPFWTRKVVDGAKGERGGIETKVFSPQDYLCDVIRFQFEFTAEIERYNFVEVERVGMRAFNSQAMITRPVVGNNNKKTSSDLQQDVSSSSSSSQTPPSGFPLDVWVEILKFVPSRLQSLVALAGVCKEWRSFFRQSYFYWTVDLKPVATMLPSSPEYFRFLAANCQSTQNLRLSWLPSFNLVDFFDLLQPASLTCVIAENCGVMDDLALEKLVKMAPKLDILSLHGCFAISPNGYKSIALLTSLRHLSIGNTDAIGAEALRLIARNCKKLEAFECSDFLRPYPYRDENPAAVTAEVLLAMASPTLRAVNVKAYFGREGLAANAEKLVEKHSFLRTFLARCKNIEEFYLNDFIDADQFLKGFDDLRLRFFPLCPQLRRISRFLFEYHGEADEEEENRHVGDRRNRNKQQLSLEQVALCIRIFPSLERFALFDEGRGDQDEKWNLADLCEKMPQLRQIYLWQGSNEVPENRRERQAARKAAASNEVDGGIDAPLKLKYPNLTIVRRPFYVDKDEDYYEELDEFGENEYDSSEEDEIDYDYYAEVYEPDSDDEKLAWYMAMNREYCGDDADFDYY